MKERTYANNLLTQKEQIPLYQEVADGDPYTAQLAWELSQERNKPQVTEELRDIESMDF